MFRQRYRRSQWLSKTSRKSFIRSQLGEGNLILGKLSALYETPNSNWIPAKNLGYELVTISSPKSAAARNDRLTRDRNNFNQIHNRNEKKKVAEENLPWVEIRNIEDGANSKEIQTDA